MENRNENRRRRNSDESYAADYNNNSNSPNWDEIQHRHNYGLPASGRISRRRRDFSDMGNANFTNTGFDRGYSRINNRRSDFMNDHLPDNQTGVRNRGNNDRDDNNNGYHGREYDYNRFGMGDQHSTWNQRQDESYDFGEHNQRNSNRYNSELAKHRGKGPKGFTRTDERIKEDINCRLTDDAYLDASNIEVVVENSEVTLTGSVTDRSSKRRAEDIAELVSGVSNVENRLRVSKS